MKTTLTIILLSISLLLSGCQPSNQGISTGEIIYKEELVHNIFRDLRSYSITPDASYAIMNSESIGAIYDEYRKDLFDKGIVRWDRNFDCNRFSQSFAAFAQIKYLSDTWNTHNTGEALAVGELYYRKDGYGGHAVNVIYSEKGVLILEPQSGRILTLSESERKSINFIKF